MAGTIREGARPKLTERERFWLRHHEACVASGSTAKAYAKAHGLSIHAFYQSRKRLRRQGKLAKAAVGATRRGPGGPAPRFAQVATLRVPAAIRYRVRLANGVLVEWEGGAEASELEAVLRAAGSLG